MTQHEGYTRLTAEVVYDDGAKTKFVVEENLWDADIFKMGEMVRSLLTAMGFDSTSVKELFEQDW